MPVLDQLRQGAHPCKKLQDAYKYLTKDKHQAIEGLLCDKKLLKYIHGPPGTGKSHLLIFLVCVALLCDPPAGSDDERNLPVEAGPQLSAMEYDKVDQSAALRPVQLTDQQKKEAESVKSIRPKILFTSGQNSAVDDLVPRLKAMWTQWFQGLRPDPVFLRMHSLEVEGKDFPRRLASLNHQIERNKDNVTDNILFFLLIKFSEEVDEYEREGRKNRRPNPSVVDKAIELYNADSEAPQETRKYSDLRSIIKKVIENPDNYLTMRKQISVLVSEGPQRDAIMQADVVICTPVGASDRTFRTIFEPHFVFKDEVARDREMTFNIVIAHYSPLAFITASNHKQLGPIIFLAH